MEMELRVLLRQRRQFALPEEVPLRRATHHQIYTARIARLQRVQNHGTKRRDARARAQEERVSWPLCIETEHAQRPLHLHIRPLPQLLFHPRAGAPAFFEFDDESEIGFFGRRCDGICARLQIRGIRRKWHGK